MTVTEAAADAAIGAACRCLHLPTVRAEATALADAAAKERITHRGFLAELLSAEVDERDRHRRLRRINEAKFPRMKRLEDFELGAAPTINPATLAALANGTWIDAGEPVVLIGDSGTGKSHLLIGFGARPAAGSATSPARRWSTNWPRPGPLGAERPFSFIEDRSVR